ncbi:DUF4907 domain-containing protein [Flavobacteriales bacterium]|nr:DUF4907 domain-containing protein [Flavobacteriales bacterium]
MITKKSLVLLLTICASFLAIQPSMAQSRSEEQQTKKFEYQLIEAAENTWGYDIMINGKLFVHQPFAPGISGNKGFSSKEKASSAAELVIKPTATI